MERDGHDYRRDTSVHAQNLILDVGDVPSLLAKQSGKGLFCLPQAICMQYAEFHDT